MEPTLISRVTSARLHVLEVIGNGIVGGMESVVQRLVERLPPQSFAVTALCPFESALTARLETLGIEVVVVPMPPDPNWTSIQTACALVRSHGIDIVHAHLENAHALGGIVGSLTGRPVLATVHGRQLSMLDLEVQRAAGTHLHFVCRHSQLHALGVGVGASHVSWIPNGVDTEVFHPRPRVAKGLRQELGIADSAPLIGYVGRLSPEKAPEVFIRAALLLRSALPDAHCVLVGDGPMRSAMQDLAKRLGIADALHFAGVRDDMPTIFPEFDMLVCPSHSESMPLVLMEAMATVLPVIGTDVGGVPTLIEPGANGWLVAPGDFEAIAERVAHVFETSGQRDAMAVAGRQRAVGRFSLDTGVVAMGRLLSELAASRRSTWRAAPGNAGATG